MTENVRRIVGALMFFAVLGLTAWLPAVGYSRAWNQPTLPVAVLAIIGFNLVLIRRVAADDPQLRALLHAGLTYRLALTAGFILVLFGFYGGGDAFLYHRNGVMLAQQFWAFGELPSLLSNTSTRFINQLTGTIYILFGSSFIAGMLVFTSLAFWGSYLFLKLYRAAFRRADVSTAGVLLFFLPSTCFWTASIGKDAAIFFFLALFVYAFASLSRGLSAWRFALLAIGLVGVARIRPHIALMLALAATTAMILALGVPRVPRRMSSVLGLLILALGSFALVPVVQGYLRFEELSLANTREFLDWQLRVTARGGSAIATSDSLLVRMATAPLTLFRPFPWEVHNLTSAMASAEGLLFGFLSVRYWRRIVDNLRTARGNVILLFTVIFIAEFLLAFSSIANFGILARQRVMLLPVALCLFVPAADARGRAPTPRRPAPRPALRLQWSPGAEAR